MEIIVTTADVFSALDAERPLGSLTRIGGGAYRVQFEGGETVECVDYDEAVRIAQATVDRRESGPDAEVKLLQARIVVLEGKLRDAGIEIAEPVEVKVG